MNVEPIPKPRKSIKDRKYLEWVASHPCLVCGGPAGQAHHVRFGQAAGMGTKPDDYRSIPVCAKCHDKIHNWKLDANDIGREEILECMLYLLIEWHVRSRQGNDTAKKQVNA